MLSTLHSTSKLLTEFMSSGVSALFGTDYIGIIKIHFALMYVYIK